MIRLFVGIAILLFSAYFARSQEKDWVNNSDSLFVSTSSEHFTLFSIKRHLQPGEINNILSDREMAFGKIAAFFEKELQVRVNLFLFETEKQKTEITGHKGFGWGFDNNIVEVFNDSVRVDPYHELVHVFEYSISNPPALIDEGLAVYLSQKFGDKPFSKLLGYPDLSIHEILVILMKKETLIELSELYSYPEISDARNPVMAYCQSSLFIEYLINNYGKYNTIALLQNTDKYDNSLNEKSFFEIFSMQVAEMEKKWRYEYELDQ